MPFPKDLDALKESGYIFSDYAVCRGCGADIEWWATPKANKIPMNPMERGSTPAIAHFSTCPNREEFRRN